MRMLSLLAVTLGVAFLVQPARAASPDCLGRRVPVELSSMFRPHIRLRVDGHEGWFLVDTGTSVSKVDRELFGGPAGQTRRISSSSIPELANAEFELNSTAGLEGPRDERVIGVIGADILATRTSELHYDSEKPYLMISTKACGGREFEERGFTAIRQSGYYSANVSRLIFGPDWNRPVAFVRLGPVTAPAVIDTGGGDFFKQGLLIINEPYLQQLRRAGISLQNDGTATLTDCRGKPEVYQRFQVLDAPLQLKTREGQSIRTFGPPSLLVRTSAAAECGGGFRKMNGPWAMIGAVHVLWLGAVAIDGHNECVWILKTRPAASPVPPFRAVALAWTKEGRWAIVDRGHDWDSVDADAMTACNARPGRLGECALAVSIKPASFGCLAMAASLRFPNKLVAAQSSTWEGAREEALEQCRKTGDNCRIINTTCNG